MPVIEPLPTDEYSHLTGSWQWHGCDCKGADDATFVPRNNVWATDKKGLFRQDTRVRVKDPSSCQVLNLLFAKDSQNVYYIMGTAKAVEDVASFEVLDSGRYIDAERNERRYSYARDRVNIYGHAFSSGAPKALKGADRDSFTRLEFGFAKDCKYVWVEGTRIKKASPETFAILNDLYSRDDKHVFYYETPLEGADPASFRVVARTTGADAKHVYFQRRLIPGADPQSFEQLGDSAYFRDKHAVYFDYEPVPGADPDTFEVAPGSWNRAKDKHREYKDGQPILADRI